MKFLFLIFVLGFTGCIPAIQHKPILYKFSAPQQQGFDKIWTSTVQAVIEAGFTIESADKNSKSITTNWNTEGMINLSRKGENGFGECRQLFFVNETDLKIKVQCRITENIFLGPQIKQIPESETYLTEDQVARLNSILDSVRSSLR
jgi:hypothetical protein